MTPARSRSPNQVVATRLLTGKDGASNAPTASLSANSTAKLPASPSDIVASDHSASAAAYSTRGSTRSTTQPIGTCNAA